MKDKKKNIKIAEKEKLYNGEEPEDYDYVAALKALCGIDEGPTKNQYNQDNLEHHLAFAEFVRERSSHRGAIAEILGSVDMNDTLDDDE